jgi:hypothetical protein
LVLAHPGYKARTKNRRLHFPEPRRHELLVQILRDCAYSHLLECPPFEKTHIEAIEEMMDARYPRYARLRREALTGRPPLHLQAKTAAKRR